MPESATTTPNLPPGVTVFERGWLSANNILLHGEHPALVDSSYATHALQTVALVEAALAELPLRPSLAILANSHLHSDHCGGNAALQARYPDLKTLIPPGHAELVRQWDPVGLTYEPTGQQCPAFRFDAVLQPGTEMPLGAMVWQVHAAPGHDPHSVILFQAEHRLLLSADALWEKGFGVVFPELDGAAAFEEVAATLDVIERLAPRTIIPGHGSVFTNVSAALAFARKRLDGFVRDPRKHALHAAKVLLKFKLLELQRVPLVQLTAWACRTPHMVNTHRAYFADQEARDWAAALAADLVRSGAAVLADDVIVNA